MSHTAISSRRQTLDNINIKISEKNKHNFISVDLGI